jgi:hypothetical protein
MFVALFGVHTFGTFADVDQIAEKGLITPLWTFTSFCKLSILYKLMG